MSKPHRKSLIRQVIERLDSKMAIGQSRYAAKQAARKAAQARGEPLGTYADGLIHSHKTRTTYQQHVLHFVNWARETEGVLTLEALDQRAEELAAHYLLVQMQAGKSPYTLHLQRSALRLFFAERELASSVPLPARHTADITRSRQPGRRNQQFQPANWEPLLAFQRACGLRFHELQRLLVQDVFLTPEGLVVHVRCGKGGKKRLVPVLPDHEQDVLSVVAGRPQEQRVFARIPSRAQTQALRRAYAQALYRHYAGSLPARQKPSDYDQAALRRVSWALGHQRLDVVIYHYLQEPDHSKDV